MQILLSWSICAFNDFLMVLKYAQFTQENMNKTAVRVLYLPFMLPYKGKNAVCTFIKHIRYFYYTHNSTSIHSHGKKKKKKKKLY